MRKKRLAMLEGAAQRGKYSPLYRHLKNVTTDEWPATFGELENILGFELPDSAYIYRPWWANQGIRGGHSQAVAWEMAGWKTSQVDMVNERMIFIRVGKR